MRRKEFIKKTGILALTALIFPKIVIRTARASAPVPLAGTEIASPFSKFAIIDLHCHPSLKMYLLEKFMWLRHFLRGSGANEVHMQEDMHEFNTGKVWGIVATHYLPEGGIETQWSLVKFFWPLLNFFAFRTTDKLEHEDESNFAQINTMMDTMENQMHVANQLLARENKQHITFFIARSYEEFIKANPEDPAKRPVDEQGNQIFYLPVAHAIEGAHALGRNMVRSERKLKQKQRIEKRLGHTYSLTDLSHKAVLPGEGKMIADPDKCKAEKYIRNLDALHLRGVCMMTLSHFFYNDLSFPVEGIAPGQKKFPGMHWQYDPDKDDHPLTCIGQDVVKRMFEIGMLVDLTHSTAKVRQCVFEIQDDVNSRRLKEGKTARPVIFSHAGAQDVFNRHDDGQYKNYGFYDLTNEEIKKVSHYDGLIGVIPENFWLAGSNIKPQIAGLPGLTNPDVGIPYILETIKFINSKTVKQDFSNVGIGTDFDGLADNPADLYLNSQLDGLIDAMKRDPELNDDATILKITRGNAMRVLKDGWGTK